MFSGHLCLWNVGGSYREVQDLATTAPPCRPEFCGVVVTYAVCTNATSLLSQTMRPVFALTTCSVGSFLFSPKGRTSLISKQHIRLRSLRQKAVHGCFFTWMLTVFSDSSFHKCSWAHTVIPTTEPHLYSMKMIAIQYWFSSFQRFLWILWIF